MRILRALALVLVLVNLLLFAAIKGFFGHSSTGEPERLANQIAPERIRIVEGRKPDPVPPAAQPESPSDEQSAKADVTVCRRYEPLSRQRAARLVQAVSGRNGRIKVHREPLEEPASFHVYIPRATDAEEAEKRVGELKSAEISDWYLQSSGPETGAIFLGQFKSEAAANALRDKLRGKGITGVRVLPREHPNAKVAVELSGKRNDLAAVEEKIDAAVPDVTGQACSED